MSAEQLATRRERISYFNGLVDGLLVGERCRNTEELKGELRQYFLEIERLNNQIDQEAVNNK